MIEIGRDDPPFIGNGWSGVRDWPDSAEEVRVAEDSPAGILVPLAVPRPLRVLIEAAVPQGVSPRPLEVRLNGKRLGTLLPSAELLPYEFTAGADLWERINLIELVDPAAGRHAVQLELSQITYMDEDPPYGFREDLAAGVRPTLRRLLEAALAWAGQHAPA